MKLGIMQPYFLPYIGYFQLINAVDRFVIHDDVQWIKNGWINRNRILANGQDKFITLPLLKDSSLLNINQRLFSDDIDNQKEKILRQIKEFYRKAPHFETAYELITRCFSYDEKNVSLFITHSLSECCAFLDIDTPLVLSSTLQKNSQLRAQERVIEINRVLDATHYINPSGGVELYDKSVFAQAGITLQFIRSQETSYRQFNFAYIPYLSILDVIMFNSREQTSQMLKAYELF